VSGAEVRARRAGFLPDMLAVAGRGLRSIPRGPEEVLPAIIIPVFFFFINIGSFQPLAEQNAPPGFDFKAFQLPTAIVFAVTGVSRATVLVSDIQSGYFDRLLMTPIRRLALLLGLMVADFVLVIALTLPVIALGLIMGVDFATGPAGIVVFVLLAALWGIAFTGFPYAIALRTGSAAAVASSFLLFFPFVFLTTAFLPQENLSGWLSTIADYNPMTYILKGLRSLAQTGWEGSALLQLAAAIVGVGIVSIALALLALRRRVDRG
jgi:ABC-2 type transport system permease protein